jgi:hypothetical protein
MTETLKVLASLEELATKTVKKTTETWLGLTTKGIKKE